MTHARKKRFSLGWRDLFVIGYLTSISLHLGACVVQEAELGESGPTVTPPVESRPSSPARSEDSALQASNPEASNPEVSDPEASDPEASESADPETVAIAVPEGWVAYTAPNNSFTIAFPEEPETQTIPYISAKYDGGSQFYFARADYPDPPDPRPSPTEVREYLELVMPGLAKAFGGDRIDYWEGVRLGSHEGRRMVFKNARGIQFETRFFFDAVQGRLFVATFGLTDDNIAVPDAQKFFESFRIGSP